MAMQEIRNDLNRLLSTCGENELKVLVEFVKVFKDRSSDNNLASVQDLSTILREDKDLLQRLAG